jgi:acyl-CoA thioester hydrolase
MYGHVNNTVYYQWFDTTVNTWLIAQGLLDVSHGDPIGLVVETGCTYAAPLTFPQEIEVGLAAAAVGSSSVTYHLGVFAVGAEQPAAQGHFVHVYVGRDSRRPVPLPDSWREKFTDIS